MIMKNAGWKLLSAVAIAIVSVISITYWVSRTGYDIWVVYYLISDSNKPLALLVAVLAFCFFRSLSIGYKKWINTIASATFGVLLIHANSEAMINWLWIETLKNQKMYGRQGYVLHAFLSVLSVFSICILLDLIRIKWIERPVFSMYDKYEDRIVCRWKRIVKRIRMRFLGDAL